MRARRILENAGAFNPDEMARMQAAFDGAWRQLAPSILSADHAEARELLATVIVSVSRVRLDLRPDEIVPTALQLYDQIQAGRRSPP